MRTGVYVERGVGVCTCRRACPWRREAEVCGRFDRGQLCACVFAHRGRKAGCVLTWRRGGQCMCTRVHACLWKRKASWRDCICACARVGAQRRLGVRAHSAEGPAHLVSTCPCGASNHAHTQPEPESPHPGGVLRRKIRQPVFSSSLGGPGAPQALETSPWSPPPAGPGPPGARDPAEGRLESKVQGCSIMCGEEHSAKAFLPCGGSRGSVARLVLLPCLLPDQPPHLLTPHSALVSSGRQQNAAPSLC